MSEAVASSPARPAAALALTFLFIGLSFALPFALTPSSGLGNTPAEVANVYACAAWAGWAHFLYAFRGQGKALAKERAQLGMRKVAAYILCVIGALALLYGIRGVVGAVAFGAVVWVYFIDHFLKAEQVFKGNTNALKSGKSRWAASYQPVLTFAWLSIVLLNVNNIDSNAWALVGVSVALALVVLVAGGWKKLLTGLVGEPLLSLFFVAEALIWGTYSKYGGPMFLTGVYVFHIAAGSYFHYLGSYFAARQKAAKSDGFLQPLSILFVNLAIVGLGCAAAYSRSLQWLTPVLGVQWFTLWVGLHLISSDLFPIVKRWRISNSASQLT